MEDLAQIRAESVKAIEETSNLEELDSVRITYLGKSGIIPAKMKTLGGLDPDIRKTYGAELNRLKNEVAEKIETSKAQLGRAALDKRLESETIDITLSSRPEKQGSIHPVMQVMEETVAILGEMGFTAVLGPQIEDDFHNFTALNIPAEHPARQMHDTFYFPKNDDGEAMVLRTHTSSVQIRTMEKQEPPFKIIAPGRTYRCDSDATHTPMFHQIEGLYIDKNITMGHLKGCLIEFIEAFFGVADIPVRFRPSYFPFTEPSAEMDIGCERKKGELTVGKGNDWLEILGCGMVHPNVLRNVGVDPEVYQGFAFGIGLDRLAMLKYGIPDLRAFFDSDIRWIDHYGFDPLDIPSLLRRAVK